MKILYTIEKQVFVILFLFQFDAVVILYGLNNGPALTTAFLQSFFIAFAEDIFVFCPLKMAILYLIMPRINFREMDLTRLDRLPKYAPSAIVAKMFPQLPARFDTIAQTHQKLCKDNKSEKQHLPL